MRVVVFGAGGFLGEHIVQQLADEGHDVSAAMRAGSAVSFESDRATTLHGDLTDVDYVRRCVQDQDAIVFSAGRTWQPSLDLDEYRRQNVEITENFFKAAESNPAARIVFTSSMSTISGSPEPFEFAEDSGRDPIREELLTPYDEAKIECERIALRQAANGRDLLVLNPGLILGPGASCESKIGNEFFILWACLGKSPFFIDACIGLCDIRDVAQAHVSALTRGQSGHRYILTGHNLYRAEFYDRLTRLTGIKRPQPTPCGVATTFTSVNEWLSKLSGGLIPSDVHPRFARAQGLHYSGSSQKAIDELGYTVTPIDQTIIDSLQHYRDRGLLSDEFEFVRALTTGNADEVQCVRHLAASHAFSKFLLGKMPTIHELCGSNHDLRAALSAVQSVWSYHREKGRYRLDRSACKTELAVFQQFFDYLYFSSDEFLSEVA